MVLQGVAWVGMAVSYSVSEGSVTAGLSKTFDGEHPCPLCVAVRKSTQEKALPGAPVKGKKGTVKAEIAPPLTALGFGPEHGVFVKHVGWEPRGVVRMIAPEAPPPKVLAA